MSTKIDMRFNDIREAVIEISKAVKETTLTNEAIAILVVNQSKTKINKTQVMAVLNELEKLERNYIKKPKE